MAKKEQQIVGIDQPVFTYWQAIYRSFFDRRLYIDVGKRWKGFGLKYFLLLNFLVTLPFAVKTMVEFNHFFHESVITPFVKLPVIYVQNGQLSIDEPVPYKINNAKGEVVTIIDTSGKIDTFDKKQYPSLQMLFTKEKFVYSFPEPTFFFSQRMGAVLAEIEPIDFSIKDIGDSVFSGADWVNYSGMNTMGTLFTLAIYPSLALVFFMCFMVIFLAFALMGQFISKYIFYLAIRYDQACRLIFVSSTPFTIILWLTLTTNYRPTMMSVLMIILLAVYFSYAIISLKAESNRLTKQ